MGDVGLIANYTSMQMYSQTVKLQNNTAGMCSRVKGRLRLTTCAGACHNSCP